MTNDTTTKTRLVLGALAQKLTLLHAGDNKPTAEHLETGIEELVDKISDMTRQMDAVDAKVAEEQNALRAKLNAERQAHDATKKELAELKDTPASATSGQPNPLMQIRDAIMMTNKLCLAGFMNQNGDVNEALLELDRDQTEQLRTLSKDHGLDTEQFEKDVSERDERMHEHFIQIQREDRETDDKER